MGSGGLPALLPAPLWALNLGSAGRGLIFLGLVAFLISAIGWILVPRRPGLARLATGAFAVGTGAVLGSMGVLAALLLNRQYQFLYVWKHADNQTEWGYLLAALWAGQEGSILLWTLCTGVFGLLALRGTGTYRRWFTIPYALLMAAQTSILAYESPFRLQLVEGKLLMPPDGNGMMPALLNYWIKIHPPTIFLGFGSLAVLFCYGFAALATNDRETWVRQVRPWAIISATLVGVGLCMGGFWAYETLGWGGFWAWDPVENTSFVPWLIVVSLIHGIFVQISRGRSQFANLMLAGLSMVSFGYGTFLTRSGFLGDTSVHSFAKMDRSALWLLTGILVTTLVSFGTLWTVRLVQSRREAHSTQAEAEAPLHLERAYGIGQWLLLAMAAATAIGMSVPLIMSLSGSSPKVVEEHLYHQILVWLYLPTILLMGVAPFVSWRGLGLRQLFSRLSSVLGVSLGVLGLGMILLSYVPEAYKPAPDQTVHFFAGVKVPTVPWILGLTWLSIFGLTAVTWRIAELWRRSTKPSLGGLFTHFGVILIMMGLVVSRGLERKAQLFVQEGRPAMALGYLVSLKGRTANFDVRDNRVLFEFRGPNGDTFVASPTLYYNIQEGQEPQPTVRPYIDFRNWYDLYVAVGPMVFEVGDPVTLQVGQEVLLEETTVKYRGMRRVGEAGMTGTRFIADLDFSQGQSKYSASPSMGVGGENGPMFFTAEAGDYAVAMQRMDAATKAVTLQFFFRNPVYPMEVYYKPLTILVWVGTGIMGLGGILATWHRRRRPSLPKAPEAGHDASTTESAPTDLNPETERSDSLITDHAPQPVP